MFIPKSLLCFNKDNLAIWHTHNIPGIGKVKGTSLTRNPRLPMAMFVRLTFDRQRLKQRHRLIPLDGERIFHHTLEMEDIEDYGINYRNNDVFNKWNVERTRGYPWWREEFCTSDIKPLHKYLVAVDFVYSRGDFSIGDASQACRLEPVAIEYCKKYNIPFPVQY